MTTTYQSFRIWYGDGGIIAGTTDADWALAPAANVQVVSIYFTETYNIWRQDRYDSNGRTINQRRELDHYRRLFHSSDYYWFVAARGWGAGQALDVPDGLPIGALKTGGLVRDDLWWSIYNAAKDVRVP